MNVPVRILLVDDVHQNLVALAALLRRDDCELLLAESGAAALELLLVHDVALALIDVRMPEMDGFELAELMRGSERTRAIPIIFMTAGSHDEHRLFRGYEAGAVDFLYKPLDPAVLRNKVGTFFELYRQRQQLTERLEHSRAISAERERLVGELSNALRLAEMLTAVLGHDLRNPLNVMITCAEVLKRTGDAHVQSVADRICSSGWRMSRMIGDLMDLARARMAGGIPVVPKDMDLLAMARRVVAGQHALTPDREIVVEHAGDLFGYWDEDRLYQVLMNLLGNAIQHGKPESPVWLRLDGLDGDQVALTITNAGVIPPQLLPTLFDPFRAALEPNLKSSEGLGLGLYIVQQIAQAHGGSIEVASTAEEGTTFKLALPRTPRSAPIQI
jgi:two-component system, sensor histidine kinase and response regulator